MSQAKFYNSPAWKKTREAYTRSVGGLCERCLAKGVITPAELVHHKVPLTDDNIEDLSISLDWNNLQALCRKCHAEVHEDIYKEFSKKRTKKRYWIDKMGRVVVRNDTIF